MIMALYSTYSRIFLRIDGFSFHLYMHDSLKVGSKYDATRAMQGVKWARVGKNRLRFSSYVSCVNTLHPIVNWALLFMTSYRSRLCIILL